MRIRKRFPTFPTQSSVASSSGAPSPQEELEVSSLPATADGAAKEPSPDMVLTDWKDIMARAHKLLAGPSYTSKSNHRPVPFGEQEEHSSTGPVCNGEDVTEVQSKDVEGNKSPLKQENVPPRTMIIRIGGQYAGKPTLDLFPDSRKKGNPSGTRRLNRKATTVPYSSWKGRAVEDNEDGKAEAAVKLGRSTRRKERTKSRSRRACADGSSLRKSKDKGKAKAEDEDEDEDGDENEVKMRRLANIYADVRSLRRD